MEGAKLTAADVPVPEREMLCGLPEPLDVIINCPLLVPDAVGSKDTPIVQLPEGGKLPEQPLVAAKSVAVLVTVVMVSGATPVFVTLMV